MASPSLCTAHVFFSIRPAALVDEGFVRPSKNRHCDSGARLCAPLRIAAWRGSPRAVHSRAGGVGISI
jgi:hypothetical protein